MRKRRARAGRRSVRLMRHKGEDTFGMKRRRMPYVAKIKRDDPFQIADRREIEKMVRRIAAAGEHFAISGRRDDAGFLLFPLPDLGQGARRSMARNSVWDVMRGCRRAPLPLSWHSACQPAA
jgi:hypothetical protein